MVEMQNKLNSNFFGKLDFLVPERKEIEHYLIYLTEKEIEEIMNTHRLYRRWIRAPYSLCLLAKKKKSIVFQPFLLLVGLFPSTLFNFDTKGFYKIPTFAALKSVNNSG